MSDLWIVLLIVAVWLGALVMLVGLCASAKNGDRTRIGDWGDLHTRTRTQHSAGAGRSLSRQPLARARRIRATLAARNR